MMQTAAAGESRFPTLHSAIGAAIYLLEFSTIAACYFGLAETAELSAAINPVATPLWPPTGVALALILLRGYRIWPAIFVGTFAANFLATASIFTSSSVGIGVILATLAGAWLLNRWANGRKAFLTPPGVAKFAIVAFVPTALIGSTIALGGLVVVRHADFHSYAVPWFIWWLADAAGTLLIVPVVVLWATALQHSVDKRAILEAVAILALAAAIGIIAYSPAVDHLFIRSSSFDILPYRSWVAFLILVPLMWAILRGNRRAAASAALIFCGLALWGLGNHSAFSKTSLNQSLLLLLVLSLSTSVPPLILAAAIATRREIEAGLVLAQGRLQHDLDETHLALDNAKRHFQILVEGVVDYAIFVVDKAGRVASWNSAAQKIIGYKAEEIIGKHFGIFYRPDDRRAGEPNRALGLALQTGKHEVEGWRIKKDGTLLFVTGSVYALRDDNENPIGFANILRDTTERRDAQEKLVQAREQLVMAQKMEAIGKLTGGIAHDFNNLLMIIGGNAQLFERLLDPKLPRAIEAIQTAAKRGETLTRQLLTFSRRQHLSPTVVDLRGCIRNMRTMIQSSLRGNIVYRETIGPEIHPVTIDLAELELAIVNIAVNARDAMPNGGTFTLSVSNMKANDDLPAALQGQFVVIECIDTGTGIPPNLLSKIFDPFFTTKEVGKGTGLGLSQVYGFAHQAGGTVKAESRVGQGTAITIFLPSSADKEITNRDILPTEDVHSQRQTVLIVDDSADVAQVTSSLFENLGYDTIYRDSADAALKFLAGGAKIDLVFSDIVMPGTIDGVGLASEIRSRYPNLPVILTTGYSDGTQSVSSDLKILRKPFDADALKNFIQETEESNSSA